MRLIRLAALYGSVVLLVTVSLSMFDVRGERRSDIDRSVAGAATTAQLAANATVERAVAVAAAASADVDPSELTSSFVAPTEACVLSDTDQRCTGRDLAAGTAFGSAAQLAASSGGAVAIADRSGEAVLVVAEPGAGTTIALSLGASALIDDGAAAQLADSDALVELRITAGDSTAANPDEVGTPDAPVTEGGDRVVTSFVDLEGGGAVEITASADADVGLVGEGLLLYGVLFALGTVLVALAGWTFRVDRRTLEHRAMTDELTGLVNRREFERRAEEELVTAGRLGGGACLMLIDLNGFKQINDTLGHQFGDLVLRACAERLSSAVRDSDVVGRWGGDEFVILLPGLQDGSAVRGSAERIAGRLSASPVVGDVTVTASIGAALYPRHGANLDDLIRGADVAMYGAKTTGVTHRIADPINLVMSTPEVVSNDYIGPERRRSSPPADHGESPWDAPVVDAGKR